MKSEEINFEIHENIWVKPKRPEVKVKLLFVINSKDYLLYYFSSKHVHIY